ncbi:MAG: DegV family protein [Eubacteriales bacterium]|nr:DegV family protein [Eubacteriales bacterium]
MEKIRIITDSVSDISFEMEKECGIDIVPFSVVLGEKSYTSRVDFDNEGFYRLMEQYDEIPKTSQITAYQFEEMYYDYFQKGYTSLILVLINSEGSATFQNAKMAAESLYEEHPECKGKLAITCHDGASYSGAYGEPALRAAKMVQEGAGSEEINRYLWETLKRRRIYFGIYNLKYAGKSGRIPSAAAFVGDKLGIKPIMKIWDHAITTAAKCRGEKKLISKIIDMTEEDMVPGSEYQLVYGSDISCREELEQKITERLGYGPTGYYQIGAAVAANSGPKVVGTIFQSKEEWGE